MCFVVCKDWKVAETREMARAWREWEDDYRANHARAVEEQVMGEVWEEVEILAARRRDQLIQPPASCERSTPYSNTTGPSR